MSRSLSTDLAVLVATLGVHVESILSEDVSITTLAPQVKPMHGPSKSSVVYEGLRLAASAFTKVRHQQPKNLLSGSTIPCSPTVHGLSVLAPIIRAIDNSTAHSITKPFDTLE